MGFAEGDQSALGCVASVPCEGVSAAALGRREVRSRIRSHVRRRLDLGLARAQRRKRELSFERGRGALRLLSFCEEPARGSTWACGRARLRGRSSW